jgi:hypothetical protein
MHTPGSKYGKSGKEYKQMLCKPDFTVPLCVSSASSVSSMVEKKDHEV